MMIIYKITNLITTKVYIGQTIYSLAKRWSGHCSKHSKCSHIAHSIQKYGKENFTVEEIDRALSKEELNEKELYWINFYNSRNPEFGYNLLEGGDSKLHSDISKQKMSDSRTGIKLSEEHKKNIGLSGRGRIVTEETRRKISESNKGQTRRKWTEEEKRQIGERSRGRKQSQETIDKIIKAQKGKKRKPLTEEHRKKLSEIRKGRIVSPETREKIRQSNIRTKALQKKGK